MVMCWAIGVGDRGSPATVSEQFWEIVGFDGERGGEGDRLGSARSSPRS
jgi:hypothetical protein